MAAVQALACHLVNELASLASMVYLAASSAAYDLLAVAIGVEPKEPVSPDRDAILVSGSGRGK
jgi:hypothetical protein